MNKPELLTFIREHDVKFVRLQFTDILGVSKNIAVTPEQLERASDAGIPFDASSIAGFSDIAHSDLLLRPVEDTIRILPWRPQSGRVARLMCDICHASGEPFEGDVRAVLHRVEEQARALGLELQVGPECEFYLFKTDEGGAPTTEPLDRAGYFDIAPLDAGENVRRDICLSLEDMGFEIEASHHEQGPGQNEIDFRYSDALTAADNLITFKSAVKTIAQRNGMFASFLPKPIQQASGSGLHINLSALKDGKNAFCEGGEMSPVAKQFLAGVLRHAREFTALTNPLVNSYKRLAAGMGAPRSLSWGTQNRSALVRVPAVGDEQIRLELRSPDPACNPYLAFAAICGAGLAGIREELTLPSPLGDSSYAMQASASDRLPENLGEAVTEFRASALMREVLGERIFGFYSEQKQQEWEEYSRTVHTWELARYLPTI